ncbi:MAG: sulfatase [Bacteroidota bacterium]
MKDPVALLFLILLLASCHSPESSTESASTPPNIILIIADDMAWDDCGAYGHPLIKTPNIDQLAQDGMLFHQAYLTASSCSPSRASILTGTYPHQTDAEQLHWPIPADRMTFVEQLKQAGYWTAQAGKWHVGDAMKDRFDHVAAVGTGGFVFQANKPSWKQSGDPTDDGSGCQQWLPTLQQAPKDRPFFLWLAAVDPHRPYPPNAPDVHAPTDVRLPAYLPDNVSVRKDFVAYYNEIYRMDQYIGTIVSELEKQGRSENTLILFISDNGRAFPREKTTLYDGGIKTPWIVKWPAKVRKGSETHALLSSIDIAPTCLSLAGMDIDPVFEGRDFSSILTNPTARIRDYIYAEDHWHDFEDYARAVRTTRYKYIRNFYTDIPNTPPADALRSLTFQSMLRMRKEGTLTQAQLACFLQPRPAEELYDVLHDPLEMINLVQDPSQQERLDSLRNYMEEIRRRTHDELPVSRTADEFDRESGKPLPNRIRPRPSKAEMSSQQGT